MSSPVIVALDYESAAQAMELVDRLGPTSDHYKIGFQLLTEAEPDLIRRLDAIGKREPRLRVLRLSLGHSPKIREPVVQHRRQT